MLGTVGGSLRLAMMVGVAGLALGAPLAAAAQTREPRTFSIPRGQDLGTALNAYAAQSGVEILFSPAIVRGKRTQGVSGPRRPADALRALLKGTGLGFRMTRSNTYLIEANGSAAAGEPSPGEGEAASAAAENERADIVVTGTRIRGAASPSPVITITDKRIREEGFTQLGDVIRSIPQNFGGGQNPGIAAGSGSNNQNITGGSALNLRGLGVDATLTLLNGRRLSYGGFAQAVDLSIIPVAAVSQIEILTDGASALYGTDAVAGVANIILNRDFEGVTVATRYGFATDGGGDERQFSLTGGTSWGSGGFIAAYDFRDADAIRGDQRAYTGYLPDPSFLYPAQRHHSGLVSFHQDLAPFVTFSIDGLYTDRVTVGQTARETEESRSVTRSEIYAISPTLKFMLPGDWTATIGGSYSSDKAKSTTVTRSTAGAVLTDNDFRYSNASSSIEASVEGSVIALPAGNVRLAAGAGYRKNDFDVGTSDPFNAILNVEGKQSSRYAFGEILLPLFSPDQGIAGLHRLSVTGALRYENYRGIGDVTTPKLGLIYAPSPDLTLKGSWGRSFKVATLFQQFQSPTVALYPAFIFGPIFPPTATVLYAIGGNTNLQPERAKTWSTTVSVHPRALPGLKLEATYFNIDYRDRVVNPVASLGTVFSDPVFADYVTRDPSAGQVADVVALAANGILNVTGAPLDPARVAAIIDSRLVNAARQRVRGIDLSGGYTFAFAGGDATLRGSASWLRGRQRLIAGQDQRPTVGNIYNPSGFRGRAGAVWSRDGVSLSLFANHVDGVIDINQTPPVETGSFTTVDLSARYRTAPGRSLLSDVEITLSVANLLDQAPPLYPPRDPVLVPYDSTNVSAIGRFITIGISKHW